MKLITGLLPADGDCIRVDGERVVYGRAAGNQRHIGYLPDVPEFYGFMTAEEYLRFCGDIAGLDRASLRTRGHSFWSWWVCPVKSTASAVFRAA